jgi:uncharacterized protein YecE (DUF72 family)
MSSEARARILVGTSGFSFPDWVGPFYPPGMKSGEFLGFYSERFDVVEVNSTYYRIPHPRVLEQMEKKTPAHFHFMVKLNHAMTHESALEPQLYGDFLNAIEPLKAAGKYDGLLAQFPWAFRFGSSSLDHLRALRDRLPGEPLFVEFRHDSWTAPAVESFLREHHLGACVVDEPALPGLMPATPMVTTSEAYVRFHGRNAGNWWARSGREGAGGDRYDYEYSRVELGEWVKRIAELAQQARRTYLFFNNCHAGQAARNAALMKELLLQQQLPA